MADYLSERRADLLSPVWGHSLSYIIRALRASVTALVAELGLQRGSRVLDFGCANQQYRELFAPGIDYVGADLPGNLGAEIHLRQDGSLPDKISGSYDAVLSTQVLEHVNDPNLYLAECFRALRPGGRLLLTTHGIMMLHRDPVDYWRWTSDGLRHILERAGFVINRFEGIMGPAATGLQLFQDGTSLRLPRRLRRPYAFVLQSLIAALEKVETPSRRAQDALVFALVAEKPAA